MGKPAKKIVGEEIQKLDEFSNNLLLEALLTGGQVHAIVSEENEKPVFASKANDGEYLVFFDPLTVHQILIPTVPSAQYPVFVIKRSL